MLNDLNACSILSARLDDRNGPFSVFPVPLISICLFCVYAMAFKLNFIENISGAHIIWICNYSLLCMMMTKIKFCSVLFE